jgi:3-polyprenyl-4-hydroxybenzoate decarboxylase
MSTDKPSNQAEPLDVGTVRGGAPFILAAAIRRLPADGLDERANAARLGCNHPIVERVLRDGREVKP